ncbi:MAG: TRAP transporter small permease [Alphaproteobacteria bacterium]|nr:TRAP transporter small permease [Alphaproteobacteria bacterium]
MHAVRLFDRLIDGLAVLAACILFMITVLIAFDALTRHIPMVPRLNGVIELTEYALYIVTVLASPWALRLGAHIMVEIVVDALSPKWKGYAAVMANLIGLIVAATLIYAGGLATWKAYMAGTLVFKSFVFPQFWLLLPLPIGACLLLIEFILRLSGIRGRLPPTLQHQTQEG